jgi:hypothetical protein
VFFDPEAAPELTEPAPATSASPTLQAVPTSNSAALIENQPADEGDSPDKPKGPPRGNLRVIK